MVPPDKIQRYIEIADDVIQVIIRQVPAADDEIQAGKSIAYFRAIKPIYDQIANR
jgi:hypothetical protein